MRFVLLLWCLVLPLACSREEAARREHGPVSQEIYIWQRQWTQETSEALRQVNGLGDGFLPLAGQLTWTETGSSMVWTALDWAALKQAGKSVGLALRIDPISSKRVATIHAQEAVQSAVKSLLERAREQKLAVGEIHLDFDAAESQLAMYSDWVTMVREMMKPVPVTFTALPAWMNAANFPAMMRAGNGYVLQVHACEKPTLETRELCDPQQAAAWVERAAKLAPGVPFRVALPTYTYEVGFDAQGRFIGTQAEGAARNWPEGSTVHALRADAVALGKLIAAWTVDRPAELRGVVWFRLPTALDQRNWKLITLKKLLGMKSPAPHCVVQMAASENGLLHDVTLQNVGDADARLPARVLADWPSGLIQAMDGIGCYTANAEDRGALFTLNQEGVLAPGEHLAIGWLRFPNPTQPTFSIEN